MKNNATYYKQAISLLMLQRDWKDICVAIAIKHPKVFVEACPIRCESDFEADVLKEYRLNGMISAIKFARAAKGWGLKESKDYVDALKEKHTR